MNIRLDPQVEKIIAVLEAHGHEAYAVGGCVRDSLLGRTPNDWDVTTSARPEEVKKLFRRTVDTGIRHGTVTVLFGKTGYEVTTYRIDGCYKDNRHPESVVFTDLLYEDLRRRDFTVNAMAYSRVRGLQDLFGGRKDLENGVIRAVGVPKERFTEDALRILRCVRFAAQLDFTVDEETLKAAEELSGNLKDISKERIREEFVKTLMSGHPEYVGVLTKIGAVRFIEPTFPEREERAIALLTAAPADEVFRLAAFLYGAADPDAVLRDLRFDNKTRKAVVSMVRFADEPLSDEPRRLRHLMRDYGQEAFDDLLVFHGLVHGTDISGARKEAAGILERGECVSLSELAVTGEDLKAQGVPAGREMGRVLSALLECVLDEPEFNKKEKLLLHISKI